MSDTSKILTSEETEDLYFSHQDEVERILSEIKNGKLEVSAGVVNDLNIFSRTALSFLEMYRSGGFGPVDECWARSKDSLLASLRYLRGTKDPTTRNFASQFRERLKIYTELFE